MLLTAEHVYAQVQPLVKSLLGTRAGTTQVYRRTQAAARPSLPPPSMRLVRR